MRVMSTPTWPVPYYERAFRHPVLEADTGLLTGVEVRLSDHHVLIAKELLLALGKGYVVEAVEQHWKTSSYVTKFDSSKQFSEAYVDDLLDSLSVAREQNVRLLAENDFSDCLN